MQDPEFESVELPAAPTAASPDPASPPETTEDKIETWFRKHFHNLGPLLDERVYNIIFAAKEELKAVLKD